MNGDTPVWPSDGWVPRQRYEQAKAASDTAKAQLAAAEAEARVAENEATYSVLVADADGTVVETLGEPGQVVSAGQTVVRLAQAGPREAVVALPETIRPAIGSVAEASVYGSDWAPLYGASSAVVGLPPMPETRTYEARYVARWRGRGGAAWRDGDHLVDQPEQADRKSRCRWAPCSMTARRPASGFSTAPPQPYTSEPSSSFA